MIGVYALTIGDRIYIGSSFNVKRRLKDHLRLLTANKHHNVHLQRAFNLEPKSFCTRTLVIFKDEIDDVRLRQCEASLANVFSKRYNILNIATIGLSPTLGRKMSASTKNKCSENMRKRWSEKGVSGDRSIFASEEFKLKMTVINRERAKTESHLEHLRQQAILQRLPERRQKSAARMKSQWQDENFREKTVSSMARGVDNPKSRAVVNLDTGDKFDTVVSAAKSIGRTSGSLVEAIQRGGKCGGCRFAYAEDSKRFVQ